VEVKIDAPSSGELELAAEVMAYVSERHPSQDVDVLVNDRKIGSWRFTLEKPQMSERRLYIPAAQVQSAPRTTITFRPLNPASPQSMGGSGDPRLLGLGIHTLRLLEAPDLTRSGLP
jgi:hypothetical protein